VLPQGIGFDTCRHGREYLSVLLANVCSSSVNIAWSTVEISFHGVLRLHYKGFTQKDNLSDLIPENQADRLQRCSRGGMRELASFDQLG
jgi:hypothetical protein